jgi:adenylate cyclase
MTLEEIYPELDVALGSDNAELQLEVAERIDALDTPNTSALASWVRGTAHLLRREMDTALEEFGRALNIAIEHDLVVRRMQAMEGRGRVLLNTGRYDEALVAFKEIIPIAESERNRTRLAHIFGLLGACSMAISDLPSARSFLTRALEIHIDEGDRHNEGVVRYNIGSILAMASDYAGALEYYMQGLRIFEELDLRNRLPHAFVEISTVHAELGNMPKAREYLDRAQVIAVELKSDVQASVIDALIGEHEAESGQLEQALVRFRRAEQEFLRLHDPVKATEASSMAAIALVRLGKLDEAKLHLDTIATGHSSVLHSRYLQHKAIGIYLEATGDMEGAGAEYMLCLEISIEAGRKPQEAESHHLLRELAEKLGDLSSYVEHNRAYYKIQDESKSSETTMKLAMFEVENEIAEERRERDRERAILYSTLPTEVANRLVRGEDVSGDEHDHATVIFADIVAFTDHAADLPARQVTQLLADLFGAFDALCQQYKVTKIKTIGDSYLAVSFPESGDRREETMHVERAAMVALGMVGAKLQWPNGEPLEIRIGMHCGPVVSGVIGTQRLQYDIWGDTVNVASRMESTGEAGRIHASKSFASALSQVPSTLSLVPGMSGENQERGTWNLVPRGETEVKGKGTMQTYWLEAVS